MPEMESFIVSVSEEPFVGRGLSEGFALHIDGDAIPLTEDEPVTIPRCRLMPCRPEDALKPALELCLRRGGPCNYLLEGTVTDGPELLWVRMIAPLDKCSFLPGEEILGLAFRSPDSSPSVLLEHNGEAVSVHNMSHSTLRLERKLPEKFALYLRDALYTGGEDTPLMTFQRIRPRIEPVEPPVPDPWDIW